MDIMKGSRRDLKLIGHGKKIVIFDGYWLDKERHQLLRDVRHNLDEYADLSNFDTPRGSFEHCTSDMFGKKGGDAQGWLKV